MSMSEEKQRQLVLLYSLIELGGKSTRGNVLNHIQENEYWYKNDLNDDLRESRGTRNETCWRNDFSYTRGHLVNDKYRCMKSMKELAKEAKEKNITGKEKKKSWEITDTGKEYLASLLQELKSAPPKGEPCYTANFFQKLFHSEFTADQLLLDQLSEIEAAQSETENVQNETLASLPDGPMSKGPVLNRAGNKNVYLRDPAVARHALARAGYHCEVDTNHTSFLRKNAPHMYMEPHHLIPMSMTDDFDVSLDREQNIFSLCSNCHNQIHYGRTEDVQELLSKLFLSREDEICSILRRRITLEELYKIYKVL